MRFWDTSAVLSLLTGQGDTSSLRSLVNSDPGIALWWGTRVELVSGACRLHREALVDDKEMKNLLTEIDQVASEADEMEPSEEIRQTAARMLMVHNLRAADALQLAAALVWVQYQPNKQGFVSLDKRLREAATREGFSVLPE